MKPTKFKKKWTALLAAWWAWIVKAWVMLALVIVILVVALVIVKCLVSLCRKFLGDGDANGHNQSTNTTYWHGTTNYDTAPTAMLSLSPLGTKVEYGVSTNIQPWVAVDGDRHPAINWQSPGNYLIVTDTSNEYEYYFSDYSIVNHVHYTQTNDALFGSNVTLTLLSSSNLVNWQPLVTNTLIQAGDVLTYWDTNGWPAGFYQVRMQ